MALKTFESHKNAYYFSLLIPYFILSKRSRFFKYYGYPFSRMKYYEQYLWQNSHSADNENVVSYEENMILFLTRKHLQIDLKRSS